MAVACSKICYVFQRCAASSNIRSCSLSKQCVCIISRVLAWHLLLIQPCRCVLGSRLLSPCCLLFMQNGPVARVPINMLGGCCISAYFGRTSARLEKGSDSAKVSCKLQAVMLAQPLALAEQASTCRLRCSVRMHSSSAGSFLKLHQQHRVEAAEPHSMLVRHTCASTRVLVYVHRRVARLAIRLVGLVVSVSLSLAPQTNVVTRV